jgi:hypothetical protein
VPASAASSPTTTCATWSTRRSTTIRAECAAVERTRIVEALGRCGGNQTRAAADLVEWVAGWTPAQVLEYALSDETPLDVVVGLAPWAPALEDNRPFNEYYFLRRWFGWTG